MMNARMVAYPNTLYMCCPTGDGAAAAILVSEDKLKQWAGGRKRPRIAASILTSDPYTDRDLTLPDVSTLTRSAPRRRPTRTAGIGPKDIALTELHDCFATAELVHYENLGLCGDGEAGEFIDEGGGMHPGLGGKSPVNVSGGLLSQGPSAGRDRRRQHLRGRMASDRGRSRQGAPGAQCEGRHGSRHRPRLGLHDPYSDRLTAVALIPAKSRGRSRAAPFLASPGRYNLAWRTRRDLPGERHSRAQALNAESGGILVSTDTAERLPGSDRRDARAVSSSRRRARTVAERYSIQ